MKAWSLLAFALLMGAVADPRLETISKVYNDLGVAMYRRLGQLGPNVLLSPLSVAAIIGMVHLGARGTSLDQIESAVGYREAGVTGTEAHVGFQRLLDDILTGTEHYDLSVASAVFVSAGLPVFEKYREELSKYYHSGLYSADFAGNSVEATEDVNAWVRDMTQDKIASILDRPLPPSVPLLVVNAVHFKGKWQDKFNRKDTTRASFYNRGTEEVQVDMMNQRAELVHAFSAELDAQLLELPYHGERVVLVLVLPAQRTGLANLEGNFSVNAVTKALESAVTQRVAVSLPRFRLQEAYSLKGPLQALGLRRIFHTTEANLTGIAARPPIALDEVLHKTILEVDEEGSEAVALSGGIVRHSKLPPKEVVFTVDHPFLFFIEDIRSKTILFIGRVQEL